MLGDFLYGLLLVTTVLVVLGIFRLMRGIRRSTDIPSERLFILTFVLLCLTAMLFVFFNGWVSEYRAPGERSKSSEQLFVERIYPPLATAQQRLEHQVVQLNALQEQIVAMRSLHPQQAGRLQRAYKAWQQERKDLSQLKIKIDREVRLARIQHETADKDYITDEFNRVAVDYEKIISDRLSLYEDSQLKVNAAMLDNVVYQLKNLSRLRRGKNAGMAASGKVVRSVFSVATTEVLSEYLRKTDPALADTFDGIGRQIVVAAQRRREVRNFSLENIDLQPTLNKIMNDWLQFENQGIYYRDQLLHAIQAEYLAVILGVNKHDNQIVRLNQMIKSKLPELYQDLNQSRAGLEKSYKTSSQR